MMHLSRAPPAGAGKSQGVSKTERLMQHIRRLGHDRYMNPMGIRTAALADATGVPRKSIQQLLDPYIKSGALVACMITGPSGQREREYRLGGGVPPPEFTPMKPAKNPWTDLTRPAPRPNAAPSTPSGDVGGIETPTLIKAQPAVAKNSGSMAIGMPSANPSPEAPAVAAKATPEPTPRAALKKEPAAVKASAGDVRIGINDSGTLVIAMGEDSITLDVDQAVKLGDFLHATQAVWRP
jgi:hypothetical protein